MLRAAVMYFAIVFAAGFVLGTVRTLWLVKALGETGAVVAETPVMLAVSWWASGRVLARWPVPAGSARLAMGAVALVLLLAAEAAISLGIAGLSLAQHMALYALPPAQIGLAAQLLFALFPWARGRM